MKTKNTQVSYELTDDMKAILPKLTKKELNSMDYMTSEGKYNFLKSILDSQFKNDDFSIEKTEKGISIFIPSESLLSPENNDKNFNKLFDVFQWYNKIKGTKKVKGTDGKVYGVQLTILEYK